MNPFDLEAAKEGKPVCTRDGRKARIICFDLKNNVCPIVAAVEENNNMEVQHHYDTKGLNCYKKSEIDLMMLPEKKEGWVNVFKSTNGKIELPPVKVGHSNIRMDFTEFCFNTVHVAAMTKVPLKERLENIIERIFVYCESKNIDIEWFITQKMNYNRLRGYKHGGKKY